MMQKNTLRKTDGFIHLPLITVSEAAKYMGVGKKIFIIAFDNMFIFR